MNLSNKLLSDMVTYKNYARYLPHLARRESFEEIVNRKMIMDLDKFGSLSKSLSKNIMKAYEQVHDRKVMPSMRGMQFAGEAISRNNVRQYNCAFTPIDDVRSFGETLFLLLSGTGVGYSVQKRHVDQLPKIKTPKDEGRFLVHDSIEGWAQSVDLLFESYMLGRIRPVFDFTAVRAKGSYLSTTGAKAPGPEPLKQMLDVVEKLLKAAAGRKLKPIEVHDIVCLISDCVLAGGIRRAALISLFDRDDEEMLNAKAGEWWVKHPYRARANNSAVLPRGEVTKEEFDHIFKKCKDSGSGEPGFFWTSDLDWGANPCCFTGDTLLKTSEGFLPIKTLVNTDLMGINKDGKAVPLKVWSNGIKNTVEIKLSSGEKIKCTDDHKFMLNTGEELEARNLKSKRLMPFIELNRVNDEFVKLGFIQGDGNLSRLKSDSHKGIEVNFGKKDVEVALLFNVQHQEDVKSYYITGYNEILKDLKFKQETLITRSFPETFDSWSASQKLSFLKGMYSANGSVIKTHRVSYKTVSFDLASKLSEILTQFNIKNYITTNKQKNVKFENGTYLCRESYDVNITNYNSLQTFAKKVGFVHEYKQKNLVELIKTKSPIVLSVKDSEKEEVFDFNLDDDTHWGVVGSGFIAHNCEIALNPNQFCNLTTVNQTGITSKKDFLARVEAATILGTLQASYTDFHYLRPTWQETTEREALIGVSFTGIADGNGIVTADWLKEGAKLALEVNEKFAKKLGINPAARVTTVKPEGTSSCVLGSSSGIHARHSKYYLRRIRANKDDALAVYISKTIPELVEDDLFGANGVVITIPQESPENAITREKETAMSALKRVLMYNRNWVIPGHRSGVNRHNVSCTINVKDDEWDQLREEMWKHRDIYSGISLLPYDGGTYKQAPFEACDKQTFDDTMALIKEIDLKNVIETEDHTNLMESVACAGGVCDLV